MKRHLQATLTDENYRAFRAEAIRRGQTVQAALTEAIALWIGSSENTGHPVPAWRGMVQSHSSLSQELIEERRAES